MNWQEPLSLSIVAATAAVMAWQRFRPRTRSWAKASPCGCAHISNANAPRLIIRSRRGESQKIEWIQK